MSDSHALNTQLMITKLVVFAAQLQSHEIQAKKRKLITFAVIINT